MNWNNNPSYLTVLTAVTEFKQANNDISGWTIEANYSESRQSLLLGDTNNSLNVYQDRKVEDLSITVALYTPSKKGELLGMSQSTIDLAEEISLQLQQIKNNALLAMNPSYTLPSPPETPYPDLETADQQLIEQLDLSHKALLNRINVHTRKLTDVQVNSSELFCNAHHKALSNSNGLFADKKTTDIYFEVAMEKRPGPNTEEALKYWHFIGLEDANLEQKLDEVAAETLLAGDTQLPNTQNNAVILIDSYGISKLMAAIVSQLDGSAEYSKGSHLKPNDQLPMGSVDSQSDKLSISIDPAIPKMAKTTPFTNEGLIAQTGNVVIENVVHQQTLNNKIAQYLNKDANNIFGNIVVNIGTSSKAELLEAHDQVLEILDFSSLLVNPSTLTWSSEIKLGLLYDKGQAVTTIKGGIVSGNLRESLTGFKFSNEITQRNTTGGYFEAASGYYGPQHMLIWKGIQIAGSELENNHA